jgi:hypothetical protein
LLVTSLLLAFPGVGVGPGHQPSYACHVTSNLEVPEPEKGQAGTPKSNGGPARREQDGSDSGIGSGIRSWLVREVCQEPVHAEAGDALDAKDGDGR